jgi:hypothetical protein
MFSPRNPQTEIARRYELVSDGMRAARVLGQFARDHLYHFYDRLSRTASDQLAFLVRHVRARGQRPHSIKL